MSRAFVVALLGAESTGKTTLADDLGAALAARGMRVAVVPEVLREFCDREGRTPRHDEQAAIAAAQTQRIDDAAATEEVVVADTTALMIAVYSDLLFGDASLYAAAEAAQRRCDVTLLTALDLPWQADGFIRDGAHVREPVDQRVRAALARAGVAFEAVSGRGDARLAAALAAVDRALLARS
jgi:nicotinamide riboside kinase